ncbi:MAG: septum formation inhibitor Maf [Proteobacteria bacterium]|nr:septum formation inhibitor Maf [Pseudomonadota bacterium]HQR05147.1 Maf family protein [Rhodocyclaceae bacterium]
MTPLEPRIYLASRSPRRRELLTQIGVRFDLLLFRSDQRIDAEVDEAVLQDESPADYVARVARAKAGHGLRLRQMRHLPVRPVLSADTTLEVEGRIIGKPRDEADARAILMQLSGRSHRVLTAVAVTDEQRMEMALSVSEVRFRDLDEAEVRRYVATGEPMDKAGAYGIQGRAAMFVREIQGSHSGIVGLPLCETAELLKRFGFIP